MAVVQGQRQNPLERSLYNSNIFDFDGSKSSLAPGNFPLPSEVLRRIAGAHCDHSELLGSAIKSCLQWPYNKCPLRPTDTEKPVGHGAFGIVWSVYDPHDDKHIAVKKLPRALHSFMAAKRAYRELKLLCSFRHENILSALDIIIPSCTPLEGDIFVTTALMQSDLHRIIVSAQPLTPDHVKIFIYQILRGLKYLHSARILHRDIKPGNILVNANCVLKICDFGLARVEEPDERVPMTHEVVTQYYRAPEILMGSKHYTSAVDVWSVGCILAELLSRRILFQAKSPVQQLELILNVLGTPSESDMENVCTAAKLYVLRKEVRPPNPDVLYGLSKDSDHEVVHLLSSLLVFNPKKRLSAANALTHPYLEEARLRYHTSLCLCDHRMKRKPWPSEDELDPVCTTPFSYSFENNISSLTQAKNLIFRLRYEMESRSLRSLYINPNSPLFSKLASAQCAHAGDRPPRPNVWEQQLKKW